MATTACCAFWLLYFRFSGQRKIRVGRVLVQVAMTQVCGTHRLATLQQQLPLSPRCLSCFRAKLLKKEKTKKTKQLSDHDNNWPRLANQTHFPFASGKFFQPASYRVDGNVSCSPRDFKPEARSFTLDVFGRNQLTP